ncbi:hypothetical protein ACIQMR_35240 [Streptomyces sp. NPDC091376]|uniref:hypothetical protein n=1 Tax=Streptomyces sp. NPDC091376 TaxID=3365994 RepID=UPI003829B6BF
MSDIEPGLKRLIDEVQRNKAAYRAVWALHQQRGARIFELQGEKVSLREAYEQALTDVERDALRAAQHVVSAPPEESTPWLGTGALWNLGSVTVYTAETVDELKAVIVSQARELARLKGESK